MENNTGTTVGGWGMGGYALTTHTHTHFTTHTHTQEMALLNKLKRKKISQAEFDRHVPDLLEPLAM
jgi:histidinol phosphatase-like PHP family hydrolase